MSQIFHMPLLLSYFQAAHCLRALIVLLCAFSCSCLLLQHVGSLIEQLLAQVWAAAQANSCPNHEHPPTPPRPQYNHNLCVSLCVYVCVCEAEIEEQTTCWYFYSSVNIFMLAGQEQQQQQLEHRQDTMTMRRATSANVSAYNLVACFIYLCVC